MALDRYEWLHLLASRVPEDSLIMATYIGALSFEWADVTNEHPRTAHLGQMGDVIGMAVGLAIALPHRKVICLDGDGSVLMELGQLVTMGQERPDNLTVFVADNGAYESIGTGPKGPLRSATAGAADLAALARAAGVPYAVTVDSVEQLGREMDRALSEPGCRFIDVRTALAPARVPPRQIDGFEEKYRFVRYVEGREGIQILSLAQQDRQLMQADSRRSEER